MQALAKVSALFPPSDGDTTLHEGLRGDGNNDTDHEAEVFIPHMILRLSCVSERHPQYKSPKQGQCHHCGRKTSFYCSCTPQEAFLVRDADGSSRSYRPRKQVVYLCSEGKCFPLHTMGRLPVKKSSTAGVKRDRSPVPLGVAAIEI